MELIVVKIAICPVLDGNKNARSEHGRRLKHFALAKDYGRYERSLQIAGFDANRLAVFIRNHQFIIVAFCLVNDFLHSTTNAR